MRSGRVEMMPRSGLKKRRNAQKSLNGATTCFKARKQTDWREREEHRKMSDMHRQKFRWDFWSAVKLRVEDKVAAT